MSRTLEDSRDLSTSKWMPDPALRAAVREALRLPEAVPLTQKQMQGLQYLVAGGRGIRNIKGLEFAQNLVELNLGDEGNYVTDLTPLSTLTSLNSLNVGGNQVANLRPLANLTNLTGLSLWYNQVTDVSPLSSLTALTYLNLADNYVRDLGPLANLINLGELDLFDNEIKNIAPLSDLKNLKHLILTHNRVEDLRPLAELINLQILWIKKNPIRDLSPLIQLHLTDLKYDGVSLPAEQIAPSEIWMPDPALWMTVRGELGLLPGVPLTKEKMQELTYLEAQNRGITDITGLEFAMNLRELHLGQNPITDLYPLSNLTTLESLHIWSLSPSTPNLDLLPLANLINLEELVIDGYGISDISILANFMKLQRLYLENNHIEDFSPLAGLTNLRELRIRNNRAIDFRPLVPLNLILFEYDEVYEDLRTGASRP